VILDFQTHDSCLSSFRLKLIIEFNIDCACELTGLWITDQINRANLSENTANATDLRLIIVSWEVDNLDFAIQCLLSLLCTLDNVALTKRLLHNTCACSFLLISVLGDKVFIATSKLRRCRDRPRRVLWPAHLEVLPLDLDLLQHKGFSSLISRPYIDKRVMTIASDPAAKDRIPILEQT